MVQIVQLLCPERHCIIAMAFEDGQVTFAEACQNLEAMRRKMGVISHCGICGSEQLGYEQGATGFKTMQEALPHLREAEASNMATRIKLDELGVSFDRKRRHP